MNYIYDVLTNFFEKYYDFYEWEKKDKLIHFKKIPIIKINKEDYKKIFNNQIKINNELLNKFKNKAEIWNNKEKNISNYILITNGTDIIGIEFNNEGISIKRSTLIVDEELDILNTLRKIENKNINYEVIKQLETKFITRKELENKEYLLKQLKNLSVNKDIDKINYLYYECFNKTEKNINKALKTIINNINNKQISQTLYDFFYLIKTSSK